MSYDQKPAVLPDQSGNHHHLTQSTDANRPIFSAIQPLCPCGQAAVMTFGFPGEPVQGRCQLHEAGTSLRKEIEPGRTHVASVERFDE